MSEWKFRLDEIAEIVDCEHKTAPTVDSSIYRSIRTTDITNGIIDYNNANCVDYETYLEWTKRAIPEAHDIILAREAPVGEVGWIREGKQVCLGQRTVLIKVKSDNVSKRFLLYYLINPETKYELQVQSVGSVVSHLNMKNIRAFYVSLPPLHEQEAIASVLSSLDDKIDLLHRQNKTLEAMAEALFRQWFVEEAGEDWEIVQVKDLCHLQYGLTQSASVENIGPKFVRITDIQGGKVIWKNVPYCHVSEKDTNKYQLKSGDILVARTGASTGENFYVYNPPEAVFASYLVRMQFANIHIARFISIHLRSGDYFDYIEGIVSGSAQPNANAQMLASFEVKMPPEEKIIKFYNWIQHIDKKIYGNEMQIRTLEQLRDTLLPKLMSGEVRVTC